MTKEETIIYFESRLERILEHMKNCDYDIACGFAEASIELFLERLKEGKE